MGTGFARRVTAKFVPMGMDESICVATRAGNGHPVPAKSPIVTRETHKPAKAFSTDESGRRWTLTQ